MQRQWQTEPGRGSTSISKPRPRARCRFGIVGALVNVLGLLPRETPRVAADNGADHRQACRVSRCRYWLAAAHAARTPERRNLCLERATLVLETLCTERPHAGATHQLRRARGLINKAQRWRGARHRRLCLSAAMLLNTAVAVYI